MDFVKGEDHFDVNTLPTIWKKLQLCGLYLVFPLPSWCSFHKGIDHPFETFREQQRYYSKFEHSFSIWKLSKIHYNRFLIKHIIATKMPAIFGMFWACCHLIIPSVTNQSFSSTSIFENFSLAWVTAIISHVQSMIIEK